MQNNIVYNNNGFAIPTIDNNGRIIENNNFFFDKYYLNSTFFDVKNTELVNMFYDIFYTYNLEASTIYMINDCLDKFWHLGDELGICLRKLINKYPGTYTNQNLKNKQINSKILPNIILGSGLKWDINIDDTQIITFEQFTNYLNNKIQFTNIQCIYNIKDILVNNNIMQKDNKLKKEIAICHNNIMNIVILFQNLLLNELSINNNKYYNRDLVQDIDNSLKWVVNLVRNLDTNYNLEHYRKCI